MMGELGFFGANLEGYGCAGMSNVEYGLVMQELERGDSGLRSFVSVQSALVMYPIYTFGSDEQKNTWLPALATGEKLGCFGLTEPGFGSNPGGMTTTARKSGDEYILNGEKMWITSGTIADVAVIWAKVEDEDNRVRGFLVETDRPGFTRLRCPRQVVACAPRSPAASRLQDVHVPAANLLPGTGGLKSPLMCLNQARYGISWGAIGAAMSCYDTALQYAKARKQFHNQPIASHQLIQEKLVWMASEISKAQLLSLQVGRLKDAGKVGHQHISMAKRNNVWMALEMRAHGPRHPRRQRHHRGLPHHAPHDEPGVGEDLRGHARHPRADPRPAPHRDRRVLIRTLLTKHRAAPSAGRSGEPAPEATGKTAREIRYRIASAVYATNQFHCSAVSGTTLRRPMRTSGDSAKSGSALMSARVLGCFRRLPAFTRTAGTFGSEGSTLNTVPVPTAVRSSPVW